MYVPIVYGFLPEINVFVIGFQREILKSKNCCSASEKYVAQLSRLATGNLEKIGAKSIT